MMVAQIKAVRKGLKTQKLAAMSAPMNRTARVMRVTSREADTLLFVIGSLPSLYPRNNDKICKIPPNLPLPKGGFIPLFGKEGLGEIFLFM
jgi:hypothetical protein